jgi:hypothetical protein
MIILRDLTSKVSNSIKFKSSFRKRPILGEKRAKLLEAQKVALSDMNAIGVYIHPEIDKYGK